MRQRRTWKQRRRLADPIEEHVAFNDTETKIALSGHPLHAMMVAFPIALAFSTFGADAMYWLTADAFLAARRAVGDRCGAFLVGPGRDHRHDRVADGARHPHPGGKLDAFHPRGDAVVPAGTGTGGSACPNPQEVVLPWGILLSALTAAMTGITGWHGGKLVFDYQIGTKSDGAGG